MRLTIDTSLSPPAIEGMLTDEIDTPALLLDMDAFEANLAQVHAYVASKGVQVRSHGKAHKCPEIALRQIQAGACGICCQKVSEAGVFVDAGVSDVLITNQVVGKTKVERVAQLALRARIGLCVDHEEQVRQIGAATQKWRAKVDVYVELDVGQRRCGVGTAAEVLALAQAIGQFAPHLRFAGIHAYGGSAQHLREPQQRRDAVAAAVAKVHACLQLLQAQAIECPTITGGGTGTFAYETDSGVYTEVQPGSYVLMDADYASNRIDDDAAALRQALFGLCTVISVHPTHVVLDGGLKAFAVDHGPPRMVEPGWRVDSLSDEHTVIVPEPGARALAIGDKVSLIPGHCDPTVNLHDWIAAVREGRVEQVWPILARGAVF